MTYALRCIAPLVLLFVAAIPNAAVAQYSNHTSLRVLEPRQSWHSDQGTIEEAIFAVRPKGIFMEVGMYLTFSARGTGFHGSDSLEVELFFGLPEDAMLTDSWLWVGDDIIRADIKDQWTASTIYEDIVRRRQDPSILYKRGPTQYELRIFPMAANETRKVKLTYLVPAQWTAQSVTAALPMDIIQASKYAPEKLAVLTWPSAPWTQPHLVGSAETGFTARYDTFFGSHLRADLPWTATDGTLALAFDAPLDDGLFVSRTPGSEFYQLALLPAQALDLAAARRVAVLFDYDAPRTTVSQHELLETARTMLHTTLTPADSFNLIVSTLDIYRAAETWLPADSATIEAAFDALADNSLAGYSNLPALLADGIDFVSNQAYPGSLLLISSSDQVGEADVANRLIADLRATTETLPPIHVVDLSDRSYSSYFIGGRYFYGNEYFYTNLTRLTGGNFETIRTGQRFAQALTRSFSALSGLVNAFDLHTSLDDGFCFARFSSHASDEAVYLDEAILQVGKCFGEASFVVEASGLFEASPFSERRVVAGDALAVSDSTLGTFWTGRQIQSLEQTTQTNDVIGQIINYSLDERVLSLYTAFLALDPSQGGEVCDTCNDNPEDDGGLPSDTEDEVPQPEATTLTAYPNPFSTSTTIEVALAEPAEATAITIQIYNAMGQLVKTLHVDNDGFVHELTLTWDGTNDAGHRVASGTYFVVVTTPSGRHTLPLVLVR